MQALPKSAKSKTIGQDCGKTGLITEEKCMLRELELHEATFRSFLGAGGGRSNLDRTQDAKKSRAPDSALR